MSLARDLEIYKAADQLAATALLRASHGLRLISTKVWAESIELTDSVGKQASGWLKSARNFSAAPAA